MIRLLVLALLLIPSLAHARRAVMEGLAASNQTVYLDTTTSRLNVSTGSYSGAVSGVGLHVSSNVVISNDNTDNIVLYATGSIVAGTWNSASPVFGSSVTFSGRVEASSAAVFMSTYSFGSLADFAYSSTTFASSLEGSTQTITVPGGMRVRIWAQLNIIGSADQIQMRFRVVEDGVVVGADEASSCLQSGGGGSQSQSGCSFSFERLPSSGQHTYSLQGRVGSGSVSNTSGSLNQFGVETVP